MLYNTSWFEKRWHETEVSTSVNKRTIIEELIRCCPEAIWICIPQLPHSVCAACSILLLHVGWTTDKELNLELETVNQMLSGVKNQVNTLLSRDTTNECEEWN